MVPGDFLLREVSWFRLPWNGQETNCTEAIGSQRCFHAVFSAAKGGSCVSKVGVCLWQKKTYRCPVFKLGHPPVITVLDGCAMQYVFHWDMMYKRIWRKIEVVTSDWNQVILSISDSDFARRSRHLLQSLRRLDLLLASWQFSPLVLRFLFCTDSKVEHNYPQPVSQWHKMDLV